MGFFKKLSLKGLKGQIFIGFTFIILFFTISAIFNIFMIKDSQKTLNVLFEIKEPSVEVLNEFKLHVVRSKMLITNWVYLQKDDVSKNELHYLRTTEYPHIKSEIIHYSKNWSDKSQKKLILLILNEYELIIKDGTEIMVLLPDFQSYNDPFLKFQAEDLIENKISVSTNLILNKLDLIISKKNLEKNSAKVSMSNSYSALILSLVILGVILVVLGILISIFLALRITKPINSIKEIVFALSKGEQPVSVLINRNDEIGEMSKSVNILIESIKQTTSFASIIGTGDFDAKYEPLSEKDLLGFSLLNMRNKLKYNEIEKEKRNYVNSALVKFNDILHQNESRNSNWYNEIMLFFIEYLDGIQGCLYLINDTNESNVYLNQSAYYPTCDINPNKEIVHFGEGEIGFVFDSKKSKVFMIDLIETSTHQKHLIPIVFQNECFGVLEIVFKNDLEVFKQQLFEKLISILASNISFILKNVKTIQLLDVASEQRHQLLIQDEELRIRMVELLKTQELTIKAKEIAEAAAISKSQFLSVMSHEIRTPLNAVIGMTNLLKDSEPKADQVEIINILNFSAINLLGIINDVLDFSKIDAGKVVFESIDFNLIELVNNIKNASLFNSRDKSLGFILNIDPQINKLYVGDPLRIGQITVNLVNNAIKFTDQGNVTISLKLISSENSRSKIEFSVSDTGIGIENENIDLIFDNFSQASSETTRKYGGTGLGLAITKKLLNLMGSEIYVTSELGLGSTFYFQLELTESEMSIHQLAHKEISANSTISFVGHSILLVEDNEVNIIVASKYLNKWKINFDVAKNGLEAIEMFKNNHYSIILMDLQMPLMDGYEACKRIRLLNKKIPIIALTAEAMLDIKDYVLEVGMTDYITKPFEPTNLLNTIIKYVSIEVDHHLDSDIIESVESEDLVDSVNLISFSKYYELADNDNEFLLLLLQQTLVDFQSFKLKYIEFVEQVDEFNLGRIVHKIKPVLTLFGLNDFISDIQTIRELIKDNAEKSEINLLFVRILDGLELILKEIETKIESVKAEL